MNQTVFEKTMQAYADCHGNEPFEQTQHYRNLDFRAPVPVPRDEAIEIMSKAVEHGDHAGTRVLAVDGPQWCGD